MTRTLTLKNCFQGNSTIVENDFIDNYLAKANGEYVKVYLLLLRHLNAGTALSIAGLADCLECTEKDILRAFKHWSKVGLLKIDLLKNIGNHKKAELTYTKYYTNPYCNNFKVYTYPQLNDSILPNYQSLYEKYKGIVSSRYPELQWGVTGE